MPPADAPVPSAVPDVRQVPLRDLADADGPLPLPDAQPVPVAAFQSAI